MRYEVLDEQIVKVDSEGIQRELLVLKVKYSDEERTLEAYVEINNSSTDEEVESAIAARYLEIETPPTRNFRREGVIEV